MLRDKKRSGSLATVARRRHRKHGKGVRRNHKPYGMASREPHTVFPRYNRTPFKGGRGKENLVALFTKIITVSSLSTLEKVKRSASKPSRECYCFEALHQTQHNTHTLTSSPLLPAPFFFLAFFPGAAFPVPTAAAAFSASVSTNS